MFGLYMLWAGVLVPPRGCARVAQIWALVSLHVAASSFCGVDIGMGIGEAPRTPRYIDRRLLLSGCPSSACGPCGSGIQLVCTSFLWRGHDVHTDTTGPGHHSGKRQSVEAPESHFVPDPDAAQLPDGAGDRFSGGGMAANATASAGERDGG